jgi:hypothetical protein
MDKFNDVLKFPLTPADKLLAKMFWLDLNLEVQRNLPNSPLYGRIPKTTDIKKLYKSYGLGPFNKPVDYKKLFGTSDIGKIFESKDFKRAVKLKMQLYHQANLGLTTPFWNKIEKEISKNPSDFLHDIIRIKMDRKYKPKSILFTFVRAIDDDEPFEEDSKKTKSRPKSKE